MLGLALIGFGAYKVLLGVGLWVGELGCRI